MFCKSFDLISPRFDLSQIKPARERTAHLYLKLGYNKMFLPPHEQERSIMMIISKIRFNKLVLESSKGRESVPMLEIVGFGCAPSVGNETGVGSDDFTLEESHERLELRCQTMDL
jgi:hypothetical protein